ncbi:MAG: hypothetical protein LQ346_006862 [Caloplaca aetnensis]|nr:MAG: hypothetical protein LQ346_006862 [Caloplaca aetnensis]
MGKSRPAQKEKRSREKEASRSKLDRILPARPRPKKQKKTKESVEELLAQASALLETSQADEALSVALRALNKAEEPDDAVAVSALPTLSLLAEVYLELGDANAARDCFLRAVDLDPNGSVPESEGGGVEKFLWLAQLSEDGGHDSVKWFEKGVTILRNELASTTDIEMQAEKRKKLAAALCGVVEIYMTDLSWEADAESRCESLITEAMLVAPNSPETLQTLANVRISQTKVEEARKALADSTELWRDLPAGDEGVPEFPARISLSRLLMEVEMENEATEVLERLIEEDDTSIEAWYLGGWCMFLMAERRKRGQQTAANGTTNADIADQERNATLKSSRIWLTTSLRLYDLHDYEDERLRDHAQELVRDLNLELGDDKCGEASDEEDGAEDEDWESDLEDEDQAMEGA